MCNKLHLTIKSVAKSAPKSGFIPCGHCYDCRTSLKNSWIFRLRVELDKLQKKGWKIGFFTLTYSDRALPKIPYMLFKGEFTDVPCFDKSDVRTFFVRLKKWLARSYNAKKYTLDGNIIDNAPRWMCCAEYGEHTQRPHYHAIICVPPSVDMVALHHKIKELWYHSEKPDTMNLEPSEKGFVYPFDFNGGKDSHGYQHKPFVCESVKAAACYAAKYVCKDMAYLDSIRNFEFHRGVTVFLHDLESRYVPDFVFESDVFGDIVDCYVKPTLRILMTKHLDVPLARYKLSDYMPFHLQSKSLGLCFLDGLSDEQKLDILKNGYAFDGESIFQEIPVYLKNKIVFNPLYVYENGKRLVRRQAKQFFRENCQSIFDLKARKLAEKIQEWQSEEYWRSIGADSDDLNFVRSCTSFCTNSALELAKDYLAYYGVNYSECYSCCQYLQWYRRYDEGYVDVSNVPLIPLQYWHWLHYIFTGFYKLSAKYALALCEVKTVEERDLNFVLDFWKSRS